MISIDLTFIPSAEISLAGGGNLVTLEMLPDAHTIEMAVVYTGQRGYSAYEVAVQNGFVGTEDQWLASLNGSAALLYVSLIAAGAIGGNRAITAASVYADHDDLVTINKLIGITKNAANIGDALIVVYAGTLNGFSDLTVNQPVFLSTNGTLTQTAPTSGYIQKLGIATSTDTILINIDPPIEVI